MSESKCLVVAVEDFSTAGIVAVEAAHVGDRLGVTEVTLLHVLDPHVVAGAALAASGFPVGETEEGATVLLELAEQALRAEYTGMGKAIPAIKRRVCEGKVWHAVEQAVRETGALGLVMGARRPHAFGQLLHPNVHTHLAKDLGCPIHVASLQAGPEPKQV